MVMCCGCWACVGCAMCRGGDTIMGDLERLRDASRDRLLERPRTVALMAPKKDRSVGDAIDFGEVGDVGEYGGDMLPDDCEVWDPTVFVRMGGMALKVDWEAM